MDKIGKWIVVLMAVALVAAGAAFILTRARAGPLVTIKVRVAVKPPEQLGFVAAQIGSARFKYLAGKLAGAKPALAQKLSVKPLPDSELLEAVVRLQTREEAQKYVAGFLETLQLVCGTQAQVKVTDQSIQ